MRGRANLLATAGDGEGGREERRVSNVMITPINTLERSEQSRLDFGSSGSSDEGSSDPFNRKKKYPSVVIKRVGRLSHTHTHTHTHTHIATLHGFCVQ